MIQSERRETINDLLMLLFLSPSSLYHNALNIQDFQKTSPALFFIMTCKSTRGVTYDIGIRGSAYEGSNPDSIKTVFPKF